MTGNYKVDLESIRKCVDSIITHSQAYPFDLNTAPLVSQWYESKKHFIDLFGGMIWRSPERIRIELSPKQKHEKFESFRKRLNEAEILHYLNNGITFEEFISENEEGFFDNRIVKSYENLPAGSKLLKSFRRFIPDQYTTRWAQDVASKYIQESKIDGYLYLSVNPIDFLTSSENNANWVSCHSLDGDYRAGNLSYMVDKTTFIAYLANDKMEHFKSLPGDMDWFSKKWRMFVHTDIDNNVYYNKSYPYDSEELRNRVHQIFLQITNNKDTFGSIPSHYGFQKVTLPSGNSYLLDHNYLLINSEVYDTREIIDISDYLGYCDLISSGTYSPIAAVNINGPIEKFHIKIGEKALCPCCGSEYIDRDDSFLCGTCQAEQDADEDLFFKCGSCYRRIYEDDENIYWVNGTSYCESCYNSMKENGEFEEEL